MQAVSLGIWAPRIVSKSDGARSRVWFDNLRSGLDAVQVDRAPLRIVDSETPEYVVLSWMAPYNRVSTILRLLGIQGLALGFVVQPMPRGQADGAVQDRRQQAAGQRALAVPEDRDAEVAFRHHRDHAPITLHGAAMEHDPMPGIVIDAPADAIAGRIQACASP